MNNNDINIDNWNNFLELSDSVRTLFDYIYTDLNSVLLHFGFSNSLIDSLNELIEKIEYIEPISKNVINPDQIILPIIEKPDNFDDNCKSYVDKMIEKIVKISTALGCAEEVINIYNTTGNYDSDLINQYLDFLNQTYEDNFWVDLSGDLAWGGFQAAFKEPSKLAIKAIFEKSPFLNQINTVGGALIACGFSMIRKAVEDEGDWTNLDIDRLIGRGSSAVFTSALSSLVGAGSKAVLISLGLSSGPAGWIALGVSVAASFVISSIFTSIVDKHTGDVIVYTYILDGVEYEVPRNGNGEYGTYDVILERLEKEYNKEYFIGKTRFSEANYKTRLYNNWRDVMTEDNWIDPNSIDYYDSSQVFDALLEKISSSNVKSWDEAKYIIWDFDEEYSVYGSGYSSIYDILNNNYDFSLEEYYNYTHNDYNTDTTTLISGQSLELGGGSSIRTDVLK